MNQEIKETVCSFENLYRAMLKCKKIKCYERYNDDFILVHESKNYLKNCLERIKTYLTVRDLKLNKKKTQIFPVTQPIRFLGFTFRVTNTGKVVMRLLPEKVVHERRKLRKLVALCKQGLMTRKDVDESFGDWVEHASKGDCYKLIVSMKDYYQNLWEVI